MQPTRRDFIKTSAAALTLAANARLLHAAPLKLPIAIQLYSVREDLAKSFEPTLKTLSSLGYQEVEAAGFFNHSAAEVKAAFKNANLRCPSAHYNFQQMSTQLDQIIEFGHEIGLQYVVCSSPGKTPANAQTKGPHTLDDWKFNAENFNRFGEKVKAAGMTFAYHNHYVEFHPLPDGSVPLEQLMTLTDPAKVHFELDCGWVVVGGGNPAEYLKKHGPRICMLHIKDFVTARPNAEGKTPTPTELGRGVIDYRPIFQAANPAYIKHAFVEQEGYDIPQDQSLKVDADYLRKLYA
ncbi:sugar phosphate isomerase/epimerase [soil metagenome]